MKMDILLACHIHLAVENTEEERSRVGRKGATNFIAQSVEIQGSFRVCNCCHAAASLNPRNLYAINYTRLHPCSTGDDFFNFGSGHVFPFLFKKSYFKDGCVG